MESQKHRPLGITIIAILAVLSGLAWLANGAIFLIVGIGIAYLAIGIACFFVAYGIWIGRDWAWTITLIVSVIGIILGISSLAIGNVGSIVNVIIFAVIIYYLYRPNVKAYFGK
jgi:hypothetical protein